MKYFIVRKEEQLVMMKVAEEDVEAFQRADGKQALVAGSDVCETLDKAKVQLSEADLRLLESKIVRFLSIEDSGF